MNRVRIQIPKERITDFCQRHHIRKLAIFGSALRYDFGPDSDVDVLVEFEPGHVPGLAFFGIEQELSAILGRKVDLNTQSQSCPICRPLI
jgi:uncharacterized protein